MTRRSLAPLAAAALLATATACASAGSRSPSASATADPPRVVTAAARARLDSTLRRFVETGAVAGVSALVHENGREVYWSAFGHADREAGRAMGRDAIVQIFSMTKPVTGVALLQLVEQGKVALDDPVATYVPELANVRVWAGTDASGQPVTVPPKRAMTVRDLTRHTAGFATGGGDPGVGPLYRAADPFDRNNTLTQMAERLGRVPLLSHPGERWAYGPAVDVQALIVERVSGMPFDRYLEQHIFRPLGMKDTRFAVREEDRPRFAALYQRGGGGTLSRAPDSTARAYNLGKWPLTPGGWGLTSSIDDYSRFARMLLNGGELDGARVLRPETVRLMATSHLPDSVTERSFLPSKGRVGFGVDVAVRTKPTASADENHGAVGEFFWDGLASTLFWVDPANRLTAVLFVQLVPFDPIRLHKSFRDAVYGPWQPNAAP